MNLFIDTSNWRLIFILEQNNKIIDSLEIKNLTKISDIAINELTNFLAKNKLSINDIQNFYVTKGPGSYTGVRVGLTIVKTLQTLNHNYNIFVINSLLFQAGIDQTISLLDARGDKSYLGIYNQGSTLVEEQVVLNSELDLSIAKYPDFAIKKDYLELDCVKNFLELKKHFVKVEQTSDLDPLYIKSFI